MSCEVGEACDWADAAAGTSSAALGLPVLAGPSLYNFQAVSEELRQQNAMAVVEDEAALAATLCFLLRQRDLALGMGKRGKDVVIANQGATSRLCDLIVQRL